MSDTNKTNREKRGESSRRLSLSILLLLIALASVTAVTVAWFSISDNARIRSMKMEITSGVSMRFDLDAHSDYEQYIETLGFQQIAARMQSELGFDMASVPLEPVTTADASTFTLEQGQVVDERSGTYLTFMLHFMAEEDMVVHLTSQDSEDKAGTLISSDNSALAQAMRISFTADGVTYVYDPGMGDSSTGTTYKTFGLPLGDMTYNDNNAMFKLKKMEDKPVLVHVWVEGTDEACTNAIKNAGYSISLKFQGTNEDNKPFKEAERPSVDDNKPANDPTYYTQRDETADERDDKKELSFFQRVKKAFIELFGTNGEDK